MTLRLPVLAWLFLASLAAIFTSCSTVGKTVAENTTVKFEGIQAQDPARQGLTVVKELLGAVAGAPSGDVDRGLSLTLVLYLENKNPFTLNLAKVTYTLIVDDEITATGSKESKGGELTFEPGEGKTVELPVRIFTRELITRILKGMAQKGVALTIKGDLTFDSVLGEIMFPYSAEKRL